MGLRLDRRMRLWLARKRAGTCDAMPFSESLSRCENPAIACVRILGSPRHVCELHVLPLDTDPKYGALWFLAMFYGIPLLPILHQSTTDQT